MSAKAISRELKKIEQLIVGEAYSQKIKSERSPRSKSSLVCFTDSNRIKEQVKLEIGSLVRPDPISIRQVQSYIHDFLISIDAYESIDKFNLIEINVNVLNIERTFIDKILAVKRHAIMGTLSNKVRHIYDVVKLFHLKEIQIFIDDKTALKTIIQMTKETDLFYVNKRAVSQDYNPNSLFKFDFWVENFTDEIRHRYESLHIDLLYTKDKQDFDLAIETFYKIDSLLKEIGE